MGFLENGVIGDGAADREVFWRIVDQGESLQLEIYSANKKLTCRLTEDNPGVWRGQWTRFERMLIEISCPIQRTHKTAPRIISFAIMTVVRPKIYIHELLRAFRSNERIRLIVGGVNSGYLKRYWDDVRIEIIPPSAEAYALVEHYSLQHRASWNYLRCLTLGPASTEGQGLLVVEDDVILAKGWKSQLHKVLNQIEAAYRGQYLLALYAAFPHVPDFSRRPNIVCVSSRRSVFWDASYLFSGTGASRLCRLLENARRGVISHSIRCIAQGVFKIRRRPSLRNDSLFGATHWEDKYRISYLRS